MSYVDGFIVAVPTKDKLKYIEYAKSISTVFQDHGVLKVVETWGDDVPDGEVTSFPMAVKCKEDETVVFSWMVWSSKEARNAAWEAMMDDERMNPEVNPMPFDGKRLIYGGFETIFEN